jgi:hypothetical protein
VSLTLAPTCICPLIKIPIFPHLILAMISSLRSKFKHNSPETNPGIILSPRIATVYPPGTSVKLVVKPKASVEDSANLPSVKVSNVLHFLRHWLQQNKLEQILLKIDFTYHGQTAANRTNLSRVYNFRSGHLYEMQFLVLAVKLPNLKLKTQPKQLLGSLLLVIALHSLTYLYRLSALWRIMYYYEMV